MKIAIKRVQRQAVLGYAERAQFGAKLKTFKLFSMAALALAMAACSNEDNVLENVTPAQQGAMKFTATVAAPGSGAMTRTTYSESGTTINVAWKAGDEIYLYDEDNGETCTATVGTPAASGSATISGTFSKEVEAGDNITAYYPTSAVNYDFNAKFASQAGTLAYIQDNLDYRIGTSEISVDGDQATLATALEMKSQIAIWKLTLTTDGSTALSATKVTIKNGSTVIAATTDITATSTVCLALNLESGNISGADITIEATVGSDTYTYSKSGVSLAKGNYYQSTVTLTKPAAAAKLLSTISSDYTAQDGETLTGTLGSNVKISIADGATVTLKDVDINGSGTWTSGDYAGITCEGDATIILEGTNTVKGFYEDYPGIFVSSGKTLVIKGTGELNASSNGGTGGAGIGGGYGMNCGNIEIQSGTVTATGNEYGAGIGGGYNADCGTITISGGIVTATGGWRAAGIGGGKRGPATSSCGNITISGGTITATGGEEAAGIGGGRGNNPSQKSSCGTITITSGVTSVTATKGSDSAQSIGAGNLGTCGAVTIEDGANVTQN